MPRNSSGSYTLPAGNPVVSGSTISTSWANGTLSDLAVEIGDSASRSGKGNFTAPVRAANGTVAAPSFSYTSEPGTGMYLAAAGDLRYAVGGVDALRLAAGGIAGGLTLVSGTTGIIVTLTPGILLLQGNQGAAIASYDIALNSTATRTAGQIAQVQNNGVAKLNVDYQGLVSLASQAAPLQPAGIWTAIAPDAGTTAGGGLGYFKDANGVVRLRGSITNNTGAATTLLVTTSPLPVGFRPATAARSFGCITNSATTLPVSVDTGGGLRIPFVSSLPNGVAIYLDAIFFVAEQ